MDAASHHNFQPSTLPPLPTISSTSDKVDLNVIVDAVAKKVQNELTIIKQELTAQAVVNNQTLLAQISALLGPSSSHTSSKPSEVGSATPSIPAQIQDDLHTTSFAHGGTFISIL